MDVRLIWRVDFMALRISIFALFRGSIILHQYSSVILVIMAVRSTPLEARPYIGLDNPTKAQLVLEELIPRTANDPPLPSEW